MEVVRKRWLPVLVVTAGLLVAGLAAAGPGLSARYAPREDGPADLLGSPEPSPSAEVLQPLFGDGAAEPTRGQLADVVPVLTALGVGVLALVAGLAAFVLLRWLLVTRVHRTPVVDQAASQPDGDSAAAVAQVRDTLRAGLADIDAGGDPRRAVIACWLRLERLAAGIGAARREADTPAELVARLLAAHDVDDPVLRRLADAYRLARYAPVSVDENLVETAREALRDVDAQLSAGAGR